MNYLEQMRNFFIENDCTDDCTESSSFNIFSYMKALHNIIEFDRNVTELDGVLVFFVFLRYKCFICKEANFEGVFYLMHCFIDGLLQEDSKLTTQLPNLKIFVNAVANTSIDYNAMNLLTLAKEYGFINVAEILNDYYFFLDFSISEEVKKTENKVENHQLQKAECNSYEKKIVSNNTNEMWNYLNLLKETNQKNNIDNKSDLQNHSKNNLTNNTREERERIIEVNNRGVTPLHFACQEGDLQVVKILISKGANINVVNNQGVTPLHLACQEGHLQVVGILISNGASINVENTQGVTPLHFACQNEHLQVMEILISKGANINVVNNRGVTPLHFACQEGDLQVVGILISKGASINVENDQGVTPLHLACYKGYLQIAKILISKGAEINFVNNQGVTPLHFACQEGHLQIVKCLLNAGAYVDDLAFQEAEKEPEITQALFNKLQTQTSQK